MAAGGLISVPFSSGSHSLLEHGRRAWRMDAVISVPFSSGSHSLPAVLILRVTTEYISVPFSSGSHSLHQKSMLNGLMTTSFQSPSHRGATRCGHDERQHPLFDQISVPFSSGSHSLQRDDDAGSGYRIHFSPLLIGEPLAALQPRRAAANVALQFQSPSHRGATRCEATIRGMNRVRAKFQSPSHRGATRCTALAFASTALAFDFSPLLIGEPLAASRRLSTS